MSNISKDDLVGTWELESWTIGYADRDELTRWLSGVRQAPRHLFVVHGELNASEHFADHIKARYGWDTSVPKHGHVAQLS